MPTDLLKRRALGKIAADVAAIATYVRQNWENDAAAVTAEQVAAVRATFQLPDPAEVTPEGQIPTGTDRATPSDATPEASPAG